MSLGHTDHWLMAKAFDMIRKQLKLKAFYPSDSLQGTENILKSQVICGCCAEKCRTNAGPTMLTVFLSVIQISFEVRKYTGI